MKELYQILKFYYSMGRVGFYPVGKEVDHHDDYYEGVAVDPKSPPGKKGGWFWVLGMVVLLVGGYFLF